MPTRRLLDCKNLDEVCMLPRDNFGVGDWWILSDGGEVMIRKQKAGEPPTDKIRIPVKAFQKLIEFMIQEQEVCHVDR